MLFIGGYLTHVDESGITVEFPDRRSHNMPPGKVPRKEMLQRLRTQEQPGGLFRTDFLRRIGGADERLKTTMDQDLLLKALILGETLLLNDSFIRFCKHPGQFSATYPTARAGERFITYRNITMLDRDGFLGPEERRAMWAAASRYACDCHRKGGRPLRAALTALVWGLSRPSKKGLSRTIKRAVRSLRPHADR